MPCSELFEEQSQDYRDSILPPNKKKRVVVEAGVTRGWERYAGDHGLIIGVDCFGLSAPFRDVYEYFGFMPDVVVKGVISLIEKR